MHHLRAVSRIAIGQISKANMQTVAIRSCSGISSGSMGKAFQDREHAAETVYFNKKDAEVLANLAKKLHQQTTPDEAAMGTAKSEISAICQKHSIEAPDAFIEDLVKYKFNH